MSGIEPWNLQIPCGDHRCGEAVSLEVARKYIEGPFLRQTLRRLTEEQYKAVAEKMGI
jgi:hypothetical protein